MKLYKSKNINTLYNKDKNLTEIANELQIDKGTIEKTKTRWYKDYPDRDAHGYTIIYEFYMNNFREKDIKLLEIGVCDKRFPYSSLKMWLTYFKNIELYGLDSFWNNDISVRENEIDKINQMGANFIHADQGSFTDWDKIKENCPNDFDFIIDDGSHWSNHMMVSFWKASKILKSGGIYFMEDMQNPRRTRGIDCFDNSIVAEDLLEAVHSGVIDSRILNRKQNEDVNNSFKLIDLILDIKMMFYLGVFIKK